MQHSQYVKKAVVVAAMAAALAVFSTGTYAMGGNSGLNTEFIGQGQYGLYVEVNPYGIAPLTALVRNNGHVLSKAKVRIEPKTPTSSVIEYEVSRSQLLTHGGIPVWGLYPDFKNTVKVTYDEVVNGKTLSRTDSYSIYTGPCQFEPVGLAHEQRNGYSVSVKKMDKAFKNSLWLINTSGLDKMHKGAQMIWNNPLGGALEWEFGPGYTSIIDGSGDIRWYIDPDKLYDSNDITKFGSWMGFQQTKDGALTWAFGQTYVKYDLMGRQIFTRALPKNYNDYSHSFDNAQNGHQFLRVASSNYLRPDGKHVRTVRDVIIEVDADGNVVDEFRLFDILDPYRDNVLKALDQGAVCLSVDPKKSGQTISQDELAALDKNEKFGDIVGSGAGRNWAHVNSVDYDPSDDSIILSSRHQSAAVKIGRDKKVKWILASPEGWKGDLAKKVLKPVDKNGKPISCEGSKCEGNFDWTWTQHTAFRIDEKSKGDIIYLSVFDNGDARGMEQPAIYEMKYSRAVIYKIDQKKMTVQQVWEYGKERGNDWYSPVTSLVKYDDKTKSVLVFSATAGADYKNGVNPRPELDVFKWNGNAPEKEPIVQMRLTDIDAYQAIPIDVKAAFSH